MWRWPKWFHLESAGDACLLISCPDCPDEAWQPYLPARAAVMRVQSAANVVPPHGECPQPIAQLIRHAVAVRGVSDIVVAGHSDCAALRSFLLPQALQPTVSHQAWAGHVGPTRSLVMRHYIHLEGEQLYEAALQENVLVQLEHLMTHPEVRRAVTAGRLKLHGWVYEHASRTLNGYNPTTGQFESLTSPVLG